MEPHKPPPEPVKEINKPKPNKFIRVFFCCFGAAVFLIVLIIIVYYTAFRGFIKSSEEAIKKAANQTPQSSSTKTQNSTSSPSNETTNYPAPQACEKVVVSSSTPLAINVDNPGLKKDSDSHYYKIYGSTERDLINQMLACGITQEGQTFDAYTTWYVNWQYNYQTESGSCSLKDIAVGAKVDYYYPQWQTPDDFQAGLSEKWEQFMTNLETHENGHGQNGIDAGQNILDNLSSLSSQPTCDGINNLAQTTASNIISDYNAKDKSYDDSTDHGRTQGAVFP